MQSQITSRTLVFRAWVLFRLAFIQLVPRHREPCDFATGPEDITWEDTQ